MCTCIYLIDYSISCKRTNHTNSTETNILKDKVYVTERNEKDRIII